MLAAIVYLVWKRQNLIGAMITGRKPLDDVVAAGQARADAELRLGPAGDLAADRGGGHRLLHRASRRLTAARPCWPGRPASRVTPALVKLGFCIMKFTGTDSYVATDDLRVAVNAAIALQRPLLIKGEPGTGKTVLAQEVAKALGAPLIEWHIKSTTKAQQGLYEYDAVVAPARRPARRRARPRHRQLHQEGQAVGGLHRRPSARCC